MERGFEGGKGKEGKEVKDNKEINCCLMVDFEGEENLWEKGSLIGQKWFFDSLWD